MLALMEWKEIRRQRHIRKSSRRILRDDLRADDLPPEVRAAIEAELTYRHQRDMRVWTAMAAVAAFAAILL